MRNITGLILTALTLVIVLSGCAPKSTGAAVSKNRLVVGATAEPHSVILEYVKPALKAKGIELEIKVFSDYSLLNPALNDKQLDANFFQHVPYLKDFADKRGMDLISVGQVHLEPFAAYSKSIKSKDNIKSGATIAIPNDATNEGRALLLLQREGLIKLNDEKGLSQTPKDIVENPKNLKFKELDAAQLPRSLEDVDIALINTNYALEAKLNPIKDSLFIEDKNSPYANVIATRADNKDNEAIKLLVEILNTEDVKRFINEKYQGAVVPAF